MHRRRKVTGLPPESHQLPQNQQIRSKYQPINDRAPQRNRCDLFAASICVFLLIVLNVELFAYRTLTTDDTVTTPSDASNADTGDENKPTFQPTPMKVGWRIKSARKSSHENSFFWKSHTPDPVPPLPPDIDPETGETLPPVIAYVVTLTKCPRKGGASLDGAAVLLHSIRRNSYGWAPMETQLQDETQFDTSMWPKYGGRGGRYRYRAYALVDAEASPELPNQKGDCARFLQKLGFVILHRPPLVPLFEITDEFFDMSGGNEFFTEYKNHGYLGKQRAQSGPLALGADERSDKLRLKMHNDGCCGYAETLKLHVYGLTEHKLAVHLDLDSLLLRPMDDLFDAMLGSHAGKSNISLPLAKGPKTKSPDFSRPIDAAFTRDYNQVVNPSVNAPVGYQGGFLVVRPSLDVLERYRDILKRGEFLFGKGWGGKHGGFYGALTFQGLLPYYYEDVSPKNEHNELELDRCIYNQIADNPRKSTYKFPRATPLDPKAMGFKDTDVCRDGRKDCSDTDCQRIHPKDTVTTHFTFCKKPWDCSEGLPGTVADDTCKGLLREWYAIRRELEDWWMLQSGSEVELSYSSDTLASVEERREGISNHYLGYCNATGDPAGYSRLVEPDDPKAIFQN